MGQLRPAPRRDGCLPLQGLHPHAALPEVCVGSGREARCAHRGPRGVLIRGHTETARHQGHRREDRHCHRRDRRGQRSQECHRPRLLQRYREVRPRGQDGHHAHRSDQHLQPGRAQLQPQPGRRRRHPGRRLRIFDAELRNGVWEEQGPVLHPSRGLTSGGCRCRGEPCG